MNFEYQISESDEKYFLKERHKKTNRFYFILFTLFYLGINIPMMMKRFWVFFVIFWLYTIVFAIILYICNLLFTWIELEIRQKDRTESYIKSKFSITKKGITQVIRTKKIEMTWDNIKRVNYRKNYIFIEPKKEGVAFLFQKKTLGLENDKLIIINIKYMYKN